MVNAQQALLNGIGGSQGPLFPNAVPAVPNAPSLPTKPSISIQTNPMVSVAQSLMERSRDGSIVRWALIWLFATAIASLVCVLQIHNQQTTPACWSSTASNFMVVACVLVIMIVIIMLVISIAYYRAQPLTASTAKRSFFYPPFLFFSFLTIAALVSWVMLVNVAAKGRANIGGSGTTNCVASTDYNAGIAGAVMALVVSMVGTIAAYHWSK